MKVALLTDAMWLVQEEATLRLLAVGLVDEGTSVVRVAAGAPEDEQFDTLSMAGPLMTYRSAVWRRLRDWHIRRLVGRLGEADVDVIHALDTTLYRVALRLGQMLDVPVVCSVWSAEGVDELDAPGIPQPVALTAPTKAMADVVTRRLSGVPVHVVPAGVFSSDEALRDPLHNPDATLSIVVVTDGRYTSEIESLMLGMQKVRKQLPQVMYFFYSVYQSDQHRIWQAARRLELLDQVSLVPIDPAGHGLMVQADALFQPQAMGLVRTLVLEAMAAGRPVVAAPDPLLDGLIDADHALVLDEPTPDAWRQVLLRLVADSDPFIDLGRRAREHIKTLHTPSKFVAGLREVYEKVAAPEPLQFAE